MQRQACIHFTLHALAFTQVSVIRKTKTWKPESIRMTASEYSPNNLNNYPPHWNQTMKWKLGGNNPQNPHREKQGRQGTHIEHQHKIITSNRQTNMPQNPPFTSFSPTIHVSVVPSRNRFAAAFSTWFPGAPNNVVVEYEAALPKIIRFRVVLKFYWICPVHVG